MNTSKIKDQKAKEKLIEYINAYPDYRLFQAIRNFIQIYIDEKWNWLNVSNGTDTEDTFHWCENCNNRLEVKDIEIDE